MRRTLYGENIKMSLHTLRSHKLRSLLTVLGVIIGVLTVIVIASILTGMRSNIISLVQQYGTHNIYGFHLSTFQMGPIDREQWLRKRLTVAHAEAILRESDAVDAVSYAGFSIFQTSSAQYRGRSFQNVQLQGVSAGHAEVTNLVISEGRFLTRTDDTHRTSVAVIGVNVADALFPNYQQIAGREILINNRQFTVVGVLEQRQTTFFGESDEDNVIFIPYRTLRKINPRAEDLLLIVRAREGQLERAFDQTEAILRRERGLRPEASNDFDLNTADRMIEEFDSVTAAVGLIAIAISGVGLLVGGIGVMNIMLVSVTERTREIGVRKAIGAKRGDIVFQFLFEAMTLTTVGGVLGIGLAVAVSNLIVFLMPNLPATVPMWAVVTGFVVSVSVGLIFGVWPAVKASKLDPIESLRYE